MRVLYTHLSVQEALAKLAGATAEFNAWRQCKEVVQEDQDHQVWSKIRGNGLEIGFTGRGLLPPFIGGSVTSDAETKSARVCYRVWGPAIFASIAWPTAAALQVFSYLVGGPGRPASFAESVATFAMSGTAVFLLGFLVLHLLLRKDVQRLTQFLKDTLEASEQPPAAGRSEPLKG